jgi:pilus assembly protein CpaF
LLPAPHHADPVEETYDTVYQEETYVEEPEVQETYEEPYTAPVASIFDETAAADEDSEIDEEFEALSDEDAESLEILMQEILSDESSEVIMNGPESIHYKKNGQRYHMADVKFKDIATYHDIINNFILEYTDTKERISDNSYLIEGQLQIQDDPDMPPTVARVHIIAPPAVKMAKVTIAKKAKRQFTLEDLLARGSFSQQQYEFLKAIARGKVTTVISGLSGSGKTTLLEAMSHYFDQHDRVVVVEDTPELKFPVPDAVYMVSSKPKPGEDKSKMITLEWLVQQTNRMRPDRIIVGETRGGEMAEFLIAANSGADGSMTTIHAQDPRKALSKMSNLASRGADSQSEVSINKDIASTVQIIIQTGLIDGKHIVTHIEEISNTVRKETNQIATTTLFEYDRRTGQQEPKGRPTDALKDFLAARNVHVELGWFQR